MTPAQAQDFGQGLFNTIFQGEVLGLLRRSIDEANRQELNLRISLRLGDLPGLSELPWEYLYDPTTSAFLSLRDETPLLRYIEVPVPSRPLAVTLPMRILVFISSPQDYPSLEVEVEWSNLQRALAGLQTQGLVAVERVDQATLDELQQQLNRAEYHVFHFIGHGGFDEETREGVLVFEDEANNGRLVSAQLLTTMLGTERHTLVLAVLNACEGARVEQGNPFGGVAQSLVRMGIPAVLANQAPITDQAAAILARTFYQSLAQGLPVDTALVEARKSIYTGGFKIEWGIPALFLRSASDGRIFDPQILDVNKVINTLEQSLPEGDPTPRHLVETLERLQGFHACLKEWKDLHNFLNDVVMEMDQFQLQVERLDASSSPGDPRSLALSWRSIGQRVGMLLDWAGTIQYIGTPVSRQESGLKGPEWAMDLNGAQTRIEALFRPGEFNLSALYEATHDFCDTAKRHMYKADKNLRETAGELYNLSTMVLGSMKS